MIKIYLVILLGALSLSVACATESASCQVDPLYSQLTNESKLLMFGELHGTNEMPAYFAAVVCSLATKNRPLKVGFEYLPDQLPLIRKYISTGHTDIDRQNLVSHPFWSGSYQDGRASKAMLGLIDEIRLLKKSGKDIEVFVFDNQSAENRDQAMAEMVMKELEEDPNVLHLLITGNVHSQIKKGVPWNQSLETMGSYIYKSDSTVVSVILTHTGGDAWMCTPNCSQTTLKVEQGVDQATLYELNPASDSQKHSYQLNVGVLTSSYPVGQRQRSEFSKLQE